MQGLAHVRQKSIYCYTKQAQWALSDPRTTEVGMETPALSLPLSFCALVSPPIWSALLLVVNSLKQNWFPLLVTDTKVPTCLGPWGRSCNTNTIKIQVTRSDVCRTELRVLSSDHLNVADLRPIITHNPNPFQGFRDYKTLGCSFAVKNGIVGLQVYFVLMSL